MAESKSEGGGSLLSNPSALLALLTVAAGLWLVSRQLTSDRPVTPGGAQAGETGDQEFEARLWEDPFKAIKNGVTNLDSGSSSGGGNAAAVDRNPLVEQIRRRSLPDDTSKPGAAAPNQVLLLPVMISGGQYSEDQESRIRSRFAVVSALGQSGYVPEDAEHIGALRIPWLTQQEVNRAKQNVEGASITQLWKQNELGAKAPTDGQDPTDGKDREGAKAPKDARFCLLGINLSSPSAYMDVRYEWYRPRVFSEGSGGQGAKPNVLVLWLDDSYFNDDPLLRLALFLEPLTDPTQLDLPKGTSGPRVALIGPRRSATLRSMLPDWQTGRSPLDSFPDHGLRVLAQKVLGRVELFCATPSAMDEVLVRDPVAPDDTPRWSVGEKLTGEVNFKSFHNFAATDAQLAHEILEELQLRKADLTEPQNHVVLISEWDTFYARMLSLTYGAELTVLKAAKNQGHATRAAFIDSYIGDRQPPSSMPPNFHPLVYLRGLDGQTVGGDTGIKEADAGSRTGRAPPTSIEELRHWAPDVNKAEGQAQFDYLGRLGDRVDKLQRQLHRDGGGEIKAIGIVGSDVYDTLLILQALRQRFPGALFFTTDLDVRFFHPREREWARNLIVASAYGLALHRDLQGTVAPFRDSTQTAQFAAVLAALGNEKLARVVKIQPRRFEVGNRTAVDLSVTSSAMITDRAESGSKEPTWLHPLTTSEFHLWHPDNDYVWPIRCLIAALLLLGGACWICVPLRNLTWHGLAYANASLDYAEEDIGGPDGAEELLYRLGKNLENPLANALMTHGPRNSRKSSARFRSTADRNPPNRTPGSRTPSGKELRRSWARNWTTSAGSRKNFATI